MASCIDEDKNCAGETRNERSASGATFSWRCRVHRESYLARMEKISRDIEKRYPKHPPADFDPYFAGERWDEED